MDERWPDIGGGVVFIRAPAPSPRCDPLRRVRTTTERVLAIPAQLVACPVRRECLAYALSLLKNPAGMTGASRLSWSRCGRVLLHSSRGHNGGHRLFITSPDVASPTAVAGHQNWPMSRTDDRGPGLDVTGRSVLSASSVLTAPTRPTSAPKARANPRPPAGHRVRNPLLRPSRRLRPIGACGWSMAIERRRTSAGALWPRHGKATRRVCERDADRAVGASFNEEDRCCVNEASPAQ